MSGFSVADSFSFLGCRRVQRSEKYTSKWTSPLWVCVISRKMHWTNFTSSRSHLWVGSREDGHAEPEKRRASLAQIISTSPHGWEPLCASTIFNTLSLMLVSNKWPNIDFHSWWLSNPLARLIKWRYNLLGFITQRYHTFYSCSVPSVSTWAVKMFHSLMKRALREHPPPPGRSVPHMLRHTAKRGNRNLANL